MYKTTNSTLALFSYLLPPSSLNRTLLLPLLCWLFSTTLAGAQSIAPDIALPDRNGNIVSLSSLRGRYVLLNFWEAGCPSATIKFPNIATLYSKFNQAKFQNASGFEVYNVSLDTDKGQWLLGLQSIAPNWKYDVSDLLGYYSPSLRPYGISSPTSFLISPNGTIEAVAPSIANIDQLLSNHILDNGLSYKVQLGIFSPSQKAAQNFNAISHIASLQEEKAPNGDAIVVMGNFFDPNIAQLAAERAKQSGFSQASIITYKNNVRTDGVGSAGEIQPFVSDLIISYQQQPAPSPVTYSPVAATYTQTQTAQLPMGDFSSSIRKGTTPVYANPTVYSAPALATSSNEIPLGLSETHGYNPQIPVRKEDLPYLSKPSQTVVPASSTPLPTPNVTPPPALQNYTPATTTPPKTSSSTMQTTPRYNDSGMDYEQAINQAANPSQLNSYYHDNNHQHNENCNHDNGIAPITPPKPVAPTAVPTKPSSYSNTQKAVSTSTSGGKKNTTVKKNNTSRSAKEWFSNLFSSRRTKQIRKVEKMRRELKQLEMELESTK